MNTRILLAAVAGVALCLGARSAGAAGPHAHSPAAAPAGSRTISSEELHRLGGVPRGWKFSLPAGDAARGRQVFADLECFKCHAIRGGNFPPVAPDPKNAGPDLSSMGSHHPAEYFAESILAPNAVIVSGPGYTGPDGRSIMPSFADAISVAQVIDLVAFLKSQTGGDDHAGHDGDIEREATAGDYRIRLVFAPHGAGHAQHTAGGHGAAGGHAQHAAPAPGASAAQPGAGGHAHHGSHPPGGSAAAGGHAHGTTGRGHLMAFVADREHGESVPYLRVTAALQAPGAPPRTVVLAPMTGDLGFHYGADVVLPAGTRKITLAISPTSMAVTGGLAGRYKAAVSAPFDWGAPAK